ncbi:MAG: hypothetical protein NZ557_15465, partial [Chthonomonadaceae bacterium]|nr:hypothetical protein [Chthonomonadaceae bacterium]
PTAALDHTNGRIVMDLLLRYRDRGAVIVVTHDPVMLEGADAIFYLMDGELVNIERQAAGSALPR